MSPFTPNLSPALQRELDPGERVLWTGQPEPNYMQRRALPTAGFGVLILAFMLFWLWGASTPLRDKLGAGGAPDLISVVFPAFGLIGLGFAVLMVLSPFFEHQCAPRTFYALTDKRALIIVEGRRAKIRSIMPTEFTIERREKSGGLGDVVLKREVSGSRGRNRSVEEIGFFGIENAREVEKLARQLV